MGGWVLSVVPMFCVADLFGGTPCRMVGERALYARSRGILEICNMNSVAKLHPIIAGATLPWTPLRIVDTDTYSGSLDTPLKVKLTHRGRNVN